MGSEMANAPGKTVLVVENQPNYTQLLVKQLLFAGFDPVVAITGEGGLRKVAECHPDMILLEVGLSDMDGMEFVSLVRQKPEADRIPIIAMSAFAHLKAKCLQGGCNDFLQKPIKMIDLMAHLKKFLQRGADTPV
jgi:two-component system, OmpR family, KDP operon response regulator KdpE